MRAVGLVCAAALALGCGSSSSTGGWEGSPADAGPSTIDWDGAYPSADPDPEAGAAPSPTFGGGAGSTFTCSGKPKASGDVTMTLTSGGLLRVAYVHVPPAYDPSRGSMLVMNFHGFSNDALEQRVISRMDKSSDTHGYIAVYPEGIGTSWNAGDCCGDAWTGGVDDVAFVKAMIAQLESDYCVDPRRVYSAGYSNGGFLSYRLACEMADTIAAISPVAGEMGIDPATCHPSRPVPVLDFHGTSDPIVPYTGGTPLIAVSLSGSLNFRSTDETVGIWREKNGCLGPGKVIYAMGDATCTLYDTCSLQGDVVHCKIDGGGHTWPGGVPIPVVGKTSTDISATESMYQFFLAHPKP